MALPATVSDRDRVTNPCNAKHETSVADRSHPKEKKRKNRRRGAASALVIGSIAAYTVLNGGGPAALRAGLMGVLLVVAPRFGRIYNMYTALAASVLLMSIFDPLVLWDVGFLLSFLGTLGIVLLTPFFQRVLKPLERLSFGHIVAEMSAVTLAAQIATLPNHGADL